MQSGERQMIWTKRRASARTLGAGSARRALLLVGAVGLFATASSAALPAQKVASIVARVAAYDRSLERRAGASVDLVIVAAADTVAQAEARELFTALDALRGVQVHGLPLKVALLTLHNDLTSALGPFNADVIVLGPRTQKDAPAIAAYAQARGILTIGTAHALGAAGIIVTVDDVDGRPVLAVNLPAAAAAKVELSSELLKLAQVKR